MEGMQHKQKKVQMLCPNRSHQQSHQHDEKIALTRNHRAFAHDDNVLGGTQTSIVIAGPQTFQQNARRTAFLVHTFYAFKKRNKRTRMIRIGEYSVDIFNVPQFQLVSHKNKQS